MPNIHHEVLIGAAPEKVYDAITSQQGLSAWWTPKVQAEPKFNSIARFTFGGKYFKEMKITELLPSARVQWNCLAGAEEWIGTTISFELHAGNKESLPKTHSELQDQLQQQPVDQCTVLILHHEGWKEYTPMFAECNYTWALFLRSLKLLCETGRGRPWPGQHSVI